MKEDILLFLIVLGTLSVFYYLQTHTVSRDFLARYMPYFATAAAEEPLAAPGSKGVIVWIMHSYVPTVRAGSELTAHAVNKYLIRAGWEVHVCVRDYAVPRYEGVNIHRILKNNKLSPDAEAAVKRASMLACQNYNGFDGIEIAEAHQKPITFFLHVEFEKIELLQQRFGVPVYVVYNSLAQHAMLPTIHESTTVRPHIDYSKYKVRQANPRFITLLNCNENKGGRVFQHLAGRLPTHQFLGIKGAYAAQITDGAPNLLNVSYMPTQEDPAPIYAQSRVVIMPSKTESWGRVALEAMAAGVPVVVSDTPGLRECTGGAAKICSRDDLNCWEESIKELSAEGGARDAAIQAGRNRIAELENATDFKDFEAWLSGLTQQQKA